MSFAWLDEIIRAMLALIPRPTHVKATHEGVLFKRAKVYPLRPGIHWYWPVWSEIVVYPIKRQTLNLPPQTLLLKDGETIVISVAVIYDIYDIEKAIVDTYELMDTIRDMAQASVKRVVLTKSLSEVQNGQTVLDSEMSRGIRSMLRDYGIRVIKAYVTDLARTRVYRIFSGGDALNSD